MGNIVACVAMEVTLNHNILRLRCLQSAYLIMKKGRVPKKMVLFHDFCHEAVGFFNILV